MPLVCKETTPFKELHLVSSAFKIVHTFHSFAVGDVGTTEDRMKASFKHGLLISSNCHFSTSSIHITTLHMLYVEDPSISSSITVWSAFCMGVNIHIKVLQRFNATYPMYGDKVLLKRS